MKKTNTQAHKQPLVENAPKYAIVLFLTLLIVFVSVNVYAHGIPNF